MGKLGGGELNVSSDIDLVFAYPEEGETDGARRISNREFFDRLGQRLIAAISHVDADGYVFRVDMRLRPYGESGPLTVSFAALEQYLVTQGRAWERYAWLKARPLTGERHDELARARHAVRLSQVPRLRRLRGAARHPSADPRAGEAQGLCAGHQARRGRHPRDRVRRAGAADRARRPRAGAADRRHAARTRMRSPQRGVIAPHAASVLRDGYVFLRMLEHRLQYRDDRQTQIVPVDASERALLAEAMDCGQRRAFDERLREHRDDDRAAVQRRVRCARRGRARQRRRGSIPRAVGRSVARCRSRRRARRSRLRRSGRVSSKR